MLMEYVSCHEHQSILTIPRDSFDGQRCLFNSAQFLVVFATSARPPRLGWLVFIYGQCW